MKLKGLMVSETVREEIRKEAKAILDRFSRELAKIEIPKEKELKREMGGFREEGEGERGEESFRKQMFINAPKVEGDCLVAEKKKW